ncbi:hypothetical protein PMIT1342_02640 [Prochlorococcus marinus str. MIT 1342]|uniref:hypothetical protein n=1 Tax=Prochlorococcus TaxID=1218 RepID=UPI0007B3AFCC|nr:hypothetical protein [Prochlorococcus marinus]KZR80680.1 hypothetical protein PMIT1342_02640 [Prochlorococcus marinus str. MIT 1342]
MESGALAIANQDISSVDLPAKAEEKLSPSQVRNMKENVLTANEAWSTAGNAVRATAAALYAIKCDVKHGNWTALIESGALSVTRDTAIDLVSAHISWLRDTDVPDAFLANVSTRTLKKIGNADYKNRAKCIDEIKRTEGKGFSEKMAMSIIKPGSKSRPKSSALPESEKINVLNQRIEQLLQKNKELLDENKRLRSLVGESAGK